MWREMLKSVVGLNRLSEIVVEFLIFNEILSFIVHFLRVLQKKWGQVEIDVLNVVLRKKMIFFVHIREETWRFLMFFNVDPRILHAIVDILVERDGNKKWDTRREEINRLLMLSAEILF